MEKHSNHHQASVVGRNPDLVMQARIKDYNPKMLEELLYSDRCLVDGWDKMMSIYHVNDWPYMKRIRAAHADENMSIMKHRGTLEALNYLEKVKEILKENGPKFSREINLSGVEKGRWSSNKYSNIALDQLFHNGEVGIVKKHNSQKCYDVIENILSKTVLEASEPFVSEDAFIKWYIKRRIDSVGLLWSKNGGGWLGHFIFDKKKRSHWLETLVDEGTLSLVSIEGIDDVFYVSSDQLIALKQVEKNETKEIRVLAPLDNLLWDRGLVETVFDFKYSWEVYVPEHKRKFGYYVLPVLYGEDIIARFEPLKSAKGTPLQIKKWWWEEGVEVNEAMIREIENGLCRFSKYLGLADDPDAYMRFIMNSR